MTSKQGAEQIALESPHQSNGDVTPSHHDSDSTHSAQGLISQLAPIDGGREAWTFVVASFIFETLIWALYKKASPTATSAVGTLVIAGQHFVPILTRGYFRTYPHLIKKTCIASIALSSVSLLIASFFESHVEVLLIFQGILYGILSGITFTSVILWLPQCFDTKRGTASGIIYSGSGLGGTVFPLLLGKLLDTSGFAWTLRIAALYTFLATSLAALLIRPRLPMIRPPSNDTRSMTRKLMPEGLKALLGSFAGTNEAIILCQASAWCTISLYVATYTTSLGFSSTTANGVLSAFNAAATIGYISMGRLIDLAPYTAIMAISSIICSLSAFFLLGFSHSLPLLITFVLIFGFSGGGFTTFLTPVSGDLAKLNNQDTSTIYLSLIFFRGIAAVGGPLIGSSLYNEHKANFATYGTNGFQGVVIFVGCGMLAASGLAVVANYLRRRGDSI